MGRLDLQLPTESPVETVDGLNRRPVAGRIRVLAERARAGTGERRSMQLEGSVMLRKPPDRIEPEVALGPAGG